MVTQTSSDFRPTSWICVVLVGVDLDSSSACFTIFMGFYHNMQVCNLCCGMNKQLHAIIFRPGGSKKKSGSGQTGPGEEGIYWSSGSPWEKMRFGHP